MNELDPQQPEAITPEPFAPQPPTLRRLFFGDDGLRAGWSMLLFILLIVAARFLAVFLIHHFHLIPKTDPKAPAEPGTAKSAILGDGGIFLVLALISWIMSFIERRPFSRFGITTKRMVPDFLAGLLWGFVCLSILVGTLFLTHTLAFDGVALHGALALTYGAKWFLGFLCVGLAEEFMTRGYIQYTVSRGVAGIVRALDPTNRHAHAWGFWIAAFLFSICLFMAGHLANPGEHLAGIIAVGLAGAVFAFSLYRTGSLWWAIGFHTSWDWAQSYFYGVRDSGTTIQGHLLNSHPLGSTLLSGGDTGPEGSIFVIPTLLLVAAIIHVTLPRRSYFLTPDQTDTELTPTTGQPI